MTLYYAVSGKGQGSVFVTRPERDEHFKIWKGEIVGFLSMLVSWMYADGQLELPSLSWKDEPIELKLDLKVC